MSGGAPRHDDPGEEQERAGPDEYWLDGERDVQPEVIGEAAEQVGGGDDEQRLVYRYTVTA